MRSQDKHILLPAASHFISITVLRSLLLKLLSAWGRSTEHHQAITAASALLQLTSMQVRSNVNPGQTNG